MKKITEKQFKAAINLELKADDDFCEGLISETERNKKSAQANKVIREYLKQTGFRKTLEALAKRESQFTFGWEAFPNMHVLDRVTTTGYILLRGNK